MSSIESIENEARGAVEAASGTAELRELEIKYLGKSGLLTGLLRTIGQLSQDEKPLFGQKLNEAKARLQARIEERVEGLRSSERVGQFDAERIDITLPGRRPRVGVEHVLQQAENRIRAVLGGLGFQFFEGPELEEFRYNFAALNYPAEHPAMDEQDTFYVGSSGVRGFGGSEDRTDKTDPSDPSDPSDASPEPPNPRTPEPTRTNPSQSEPLLLRTQCTAIQGRVFETHKPPLRFFTVGRCFRNEAVDRTHSHTFHQVDAFMIDEGVSMAHLKGTLRAFARAMFGDDAQVRFRPDFFPFVEPGVDYAISTKRLFAGRWVELGGAGLIHPNILETYGFDPERYSGFAFGLGTERIPMMRYGVDDLRLFLENDARFLEQFA